MILFYSDAIMCYFSCLRSWAMKTKGYDFEFLPKHFLATLICTCTFISVFIFMKILYNFSLKTLIVK